MADLPINLDSTYPDDPSDESRELHQQHHDVIHGLVNALDGDTPDASTLAAVIDDDTFATASSTTVPTSESVVTLVNAIPELTTSDTSKVPISTSSGVTTLDVDNLIERDLEVSGFSGAATAALTDRNAFKMAYSPANPVSLELPQDSAVAFPVGSQIHVMWLDASSVAFVAGTGASVGVATGYTLALRASGSVATAVKIAANSWTVFGDLVEA